MDQEFTVLCHPDDAPMVEEAVKEIFGNARSASNPEVAHALELARKKYGPNLEFAMAQACGEASAKKSHDPSQQKLTPEMARKGQEQIMQRLGGLPVGHKVHPRKAHASGVENKRLGMGRVSPYYNAPKSDHFWFAGYDGKTIQEAIETQ